MAVLGLHFCARAFSSCGKWGPLFIAVRGPLTIAASFVVEHRLQTRRLSNCGSRAQLLHGMWDLPRPGLEPVSPALAGRLSTTAPPGKPRLWWFLKRNPVIQIVVPLYKIHHFSVSHFKAFNLRFQVAWFDMSKLCFMFVFILFGVCYASWICKFVFHQFFCSYFFKYFFYNNLFSFWYLSDINFRPFETVPQVPEALV